MRNHRIAIQGTQSSFHDLAAKKFYGQDVTILACRSFRETCEKVLNNEADYAVMAIENAIAGSILANYNLITEFHLKIIGEVRLKVELHLIALPGTSLDQVKVIRSHPMAIAQCGEFLAKHSEWKVEEWNDTAVCARQIAQGFLKNVAAIANREAAIENGLKILVKNIETSGLNSTRFMILSKAGSSPVLPDKASLCFHLQHEVGSLADVLSILKRKGVNLSKIQSVPVSGKKNEYVFHADVEWSNYNNYKNAIKRVSRITRELSILGEYKKANNNL